MAQRTPSSLPQRIYGFRLPHDTNSGNGYLSLVAECAQPGRGKHIVTNTVYVYERESGTDEEN